LTPFSVYRSADLPKLAGLVLLYALMAKLSLGFSALAGSVALFWLPGGLALGALLIGGARYWPGVLLGATLAHLGQPWPVPLLIGVGNSAEVLLCLWLLTRMRQFDARLTRAHDFVLLLGVALLGPLPALAVGTLALTAFGALAPELAGRVALYWWMGDFLSLLLLTPMLLVWRQPATLPARPRAVPELLLLLALTLLFGLIVFFDALRLVRGPLASAFLMFTVVIWGAMRFGRHVALLVLGMVTAQALLSVLAGTGFFADDLQQTGLAGLWIYLVTLAAVGIALATVSDERNTSQQALAASSARFLAFMDHLPGLAYIKDAQRRYLYANRAFEAGRLTGSPSQGALGKTMEQLQPPHVPPEMIDQVRAGDDLVLVQRQVHEQELAIGPDGRTTLLAIKFPLTDSDGQPLIGGITIDISERKHASARIARLTQLYKALSEVNQGIVRLADATDLFPLVCRTAVEYGGVKMAWIGCVDETSGERQSIVPVARYGAELDYLDGLTLSARADLPEGRGQIGAVYREGRAVVSNDLSVRDNMELWRERVRRHGFCSCASFPILRGGQRHAVLSVYHEQVDAFDDEAVRLLEEMASDVSFALDNFDREQERREAVDALRVSEQHFRAFFEGSTVGMATNGVDKRWLDVNAALCDMLGYSREELLRMTWADVTHPEDLVNDIHLFNQALLGINDDYELEKRLVRKDGGVIHTLTTVRCLRRADGSIDYFAALTQNVTEKKQSDELLWRQANFDTLTGLPNRRMFADRLQQEIGKRHQAQMPLALLFIDLDRFKEVNDTLGHAKGDALLIEASHRIRSCVRAADTVARLGGDEFMIILPELPDVGQVDAIADTLLQQLNEAFQLDGNAVYVSASIGITLYPTDGDSVEQLIRNADQAMYAAKNLGRNRYSYFTSALQEAAQTRQRVITDLREALAQRQFELYFQPIVDLASNRIVKAEALLRWRHPLHGIISPLEFIPLAEETGLIIDIGNRVFHEAARWAQRWHTGVAPDIQISVNTSPVEFHSDRYDPVALLAYLQRLGLNGSSIAIEITEGMLLNAEQRVIDHLLRFRDAGVQIAIDDFGTGYSSLATLNRFDIDVLKIDQAFVRNLASNPHDMALSEAIIVMAHKLGLQVVAEGVETEQQRALLQAAGCDFGQGYLFSRPLPAPQFEELLAAQASGAALR